MKTMGQFLAEGHRLIYAIRPDATVREALELMAQKTSEPCWLWMGPS